MAQDRVLGEQVDIIDLTGDIATNATAIGNIATGLANDPIASADLAAGLNHTDIGTGAGLNTHLQIDQHIAATDVHFTTINGLGDVDLDTTPPVEGNILSWQNGSSTWIPGVRVENPMTAHLDTAGFRLITDDVVTAVNTNAILLWGGRNDYASGGFTAGGVGILGGLATNGNTGGVLNFEAGVTYGTTIGATAKFTSGRTSHTSGAGGVLSITAGIGDAGADGGEIKISGGFSSHANGGKITIAGGHSGVTAGTGAGEVSILGGENFNLTTPQAGGNVNIEGGATTTAGGQSGSVNIRPGGKSGNTEGSINFYAPTALSGEASINLWSESSDSGYIALKAPVLSGSPMTVRTWILPQDDPTTVAGYSLTTDTNGVLSFAEPVYSPLVISSDITTSRELVLGDAGNMVTMNNAAANDLVIPTNATVAFAIGTEVVISQFGAGQTTFVSGGTGSPPTVTIHGTSGLVALAEQYSVATLIKVATDAWLLTGDLV